MRKIPENFMLLLSQGARFAYCFKLTKDKRSFFFTQNDSKVVIDDVSYLPYSGLYLEKGVFNDSAQNYIIITGIFEENGIEKNEDLTDYEVEIIMFFQDSNVKYSLLTYFCSKLVRDALKFTMYLQPMANKLQQTLLDNFGSTCRAQFGDHRCGVDKTTYREGTYCDKNFRTCCNKFNNAVNFRGEPFIPCAP